MSSKRTGRALADVMGELDEEPAAAPIAVATLTPLPFETPHRRRSCRSTCKSPPATVSGFASLASTPGLACRSWGMRRGTDCWKRVGWSRWRR